MRRTVTQATVQADYAALKRVLPNVGALRRDDFFKTWFIGKWQIGETAREASAFLQGVAAGVRASAFSTTQAS